MKDKIEFKHWVLGGETIYYPIINGKEIGGPYIYCERFITRRALHMHYNKAIKEGKRNINLNKY